MLEMPDRLSTVQRGVLWAGLLAGWQAVAGVAGHPFFPAPVDVWTALLALISSDIFLDTVIVTVSRVSIAILLTVVVGTVLFAGAARNRYVNFLLRDVVFPLTYSLPPMIWTFTVLILLGLGGASPVVIVMLVTAPYFLVNMVEGARSIDDDLVEMGEVFGSDPYRRLRHVIAPLFIPHLLSAVRSLLTSSWKVILLAEFFAATSGIGYRLQTALSAHDMAAIMAWGIVMLAMVMATDQAVQRLDRAVLRQHLHTT